MYCLVVKDFGNRYICKFYTIILITMKHRKIYVRKYHPVNLIQLQNGYRITLKRYNKFVDIYITKDFANISEFSPIVDLNELKMFIMQNLRLQQNKPKTANDIKVGNLEQYDFLKRYLNL